MGWKKKPSKQLGENDNGIKVGCWNKGGALQPLQEKINEIEILLKTNRFGVLGILEANFFAENDKQDIEISGYRVFWDKGRENIRRKNSRCVLYIRNDLSYKLRGDLMKEDIPEIWIEIGEANKKRSLLCVYYREFSEWNQRETTEAMKIQKERFGEWLFKAGLQA